EAQYCTFSNHCLRFMLTSLLTMQNSLTVVDQTFRIHNLKELAYLKDISSIYKRPNPHLYGLPRRKQLHHSTTTPLGLFVLFVGIRT
ncbi:MAG: hypothetical protein K9M80_09315, partial [Candidatus Marinimicrobia bacterium]|nr:hypothetical protein [Candidatus Neomarinimicrobiota bacterium]